MVNEETHECAVCGHKGTDVSWQETYKPGYYCDDEEACFRRYSIHRDTIDTFVTGDE